MSRGRPPQSVLCIALPVAWSRGFVTPCRRERGSVCDFVIHAAAYTAVVLVQRTRRLHGSIGEIEFQYAEQISRLRLVPQCQGRFLELWTGSPYGVLRFFRLTTTGLIELCCTGDPLASAR
ncbi:hypothetical protein [Methanoregula sp.]|uniref:hypothetical protein n=1 Tax=Methanoregula sp. TaxID=2052170 RepID=UPI0025F6D5FC|nr:hypothetical protein [Methanoregula sp.]